MNIIINPGTEPQINTKEENAVKVAEYLIEDLKPIEFTFERYPNGDTDRGWYAFHFKNKEVENIEIDIPGIDPDIVRKGQAWVSPRLYVNGSSWLYGIALNIIDGIVNREE